MSCAPHFTSPASRAWIRPLRASLRRRRPRGPASAPASRVNALHGCHKRARARTVERVQAAVLQLGYRPDPAAARLARKRSARLVFAAGRHNNWLAAEPAGAGGGALAGRAARHTA